MVAARATPSPTAAPMTFERGAFGSPERRLREMMGFSVVGAMSIDQFERPRAELGELLWMSDEVSGW